MSKTEKLETVEVTLKLPSEIVQFLQKFTDFVGSTVNDFFRERHNK